MTQKKQDDVRTVKATPHKRFFIDMITRDISLEACVLDLVDNAVDGATRETAEPANRRRRATKPQPLSAGGERYADFKIEIRHSNEQFRIHDNCGGIPIKVACEYAFNFGRDPSAREDGATASGIGIYGIGMKRALFKLGDSFRIHSEAEGEAFEMDVDVDEWAEAPVWELTLVAKPRSSKPPGTTIEVRDLRPGVAAELHTDAFQARLIQTVARTYAGFINQQLDIRVNGTPVKAIEFKFLHGRDFQPLHETFSLINPRPIKAVVDIEIWAGAASAATGSRPGEDEDEDASMWGWYVLCNNRVVLSADKSERTGWGILKFPQWHAQYNGFIGIISFRCDEPYALPWTTTKNDVDTDSVVYRLARQRMQEVAREYITYSRARKANLETARRMEDEAGSTPVTRVSKPQKMKTPAVPETSAGNVNILYQKPKRQVAKIAAALGDPSMSAAQVGIRTFDHYYETEGL